MLTEERQGLIVRLLTAEGAVGVADLARRLKVSRETIRRDLNRLAASGALRTTRGGALAVASAEPDARSAIAASRWWWRRNCAAGPPDRKE